MYIKHTLRAVVILVLVVVCTLTIGMVYGTKINNDLMARATASQNACDQLHYIYMVKFDCCNTDFPGCKGIKNAYSKAGCGELSCGLVCIPEAECESAADCGDGDCIFKRIITKCIDWSGYPDAKTYCQATYGSDAKAMEKPIQSGIKQGTETECDVCVYLESPGKCVCESTCVPKAECESDADCGDGLCVFEVSSDKKYQSPEGPGQCICEPMPIDKPNEPINPDKNPREACTDDVCCRAAGCEYFIPLGSKCEKQTSVYCESLSCCGTQIQSD